MGWWKMEPEQLMKQAPSTIEFYMHKGIKAIDSQVMATPKSTLIFCQHSSPVVCMTSTQQYAELLICLLC